MIATFVSSLEAKTQLSASVWQFRFETGDHPLHFQAGQYIILHIPQDTGKIARRLYSMSSSPAQKDSFELIIEIVPGGTASDYLMQLQPGDTITTQGPAGHFTLQNPVRPIIFLATGTGIAPIKSMIHDLLEQHQTKQSISLFWGFPLYDDTYLFPAFHQLHTQYPNFSFYNCLSREDTLSCVPDQQHASFFALGHVQDAVTKQIATPLTEYDFYLCGGPKIVDSLKKWTLEQGVPIEQIHFEKFTA